MKIKTAGIAHVFLLFGIIALGAFLIFFSNQFPSLRALIFPHASEPAVPQAVTGTKKVAVILINFSDSNLVSPTKAEVSNLITTSLPDFYLKSSYGKLNFSQTASDVYGPFTINKAYSCNAYTDIRLNAPSVTTGVTYSNYQYIMYVFPNNVTSCGSLNGYSTTTTISAVTYPVSFIPSNVFGLRTVAHELGHNLGLKHAAAMDCGGISTPMGNVTCTDYEYSDPWDLMGSWNYDINPQAPTASRDLSASRKEYLGWLNASNIATVTSSQTLDLYPLESTTNGVQMIKIKKNSDVNNNEYYFIENRFPTSGSVDQGIETSATNGIVVRLASPDNFGYNTRLIDATPNSLTGITADFTDAAIKPGSINQVVFAGGPNNTGFVVRLNSKNTTNGVASVGIDMAENPSNPSRTLTTNLKVNGSNGPLIVAPNSTLSLTWSSLSASTCEAESSSPGWTGTLATSGSKQVSIGSTGLTFVIYCKGTWGLTRDAVTVQVDNKVSDSVIGFFVNEQTGPLTVPASLNPTVTWSVQPYTGASVVSCTASGGWSGPKAAAGTLALSNLTAGNKTYILTCTFKQANSTSTYTLSKQVDVNVEAQGATPPAAIKSGQRGWLERWYKSLSGTTRADTSVFNSLKKTSVKSSAIRYDWLASGSPDIATLGTDYFAGRFTTQMIPLETGSYTVVLTQDDGARLKFGSTYLVNKWTTTPAVTTAKINLVAGRPYDVTLEYFEGTGTAKLMLDMGITPGVPGAFYLVSTDNGI